MYDYLAAHQDPPTPAISAVDGLASRGSSRTEAYRIGTSSGETHPSSAHSHEESHSRTRHPSTPCTTTGPRASSEFGSTESDCHRRAGPEPLLIPPSVDPAFRFLMPEVLARILRDEASFRALRHDAHPEIHRLRAKYEPDVKALVRLIREIEADDRRRVHVKKRHWSSDASAYEAPSRKRLSCGYGQTRWRDDGPQTIKSPSGVWTPTHERRMPDAVHSSDSKTTQFVSNRAPGLDGGIDRTPRDHPSARRTRQQDEDLAAANQLASP